MRGIYIIHCIAGPMNARKDHKLDYDGLYDLKQTQIHHQVSGKHLTASSNNGKSTAHSYNHQSSVSSNSPHYYRLNSTHSPHGVKQQQQQQQQQQPVLNSRKRCSSKSPDGVSNNKYHHPHPHPQQHPAPVNHTAVSASADNVRRPTHPDKHHPSEVKKSSLDKKIPPGIPRAGDWTEHVSSSGKKYYYNIRSGVSQWEKPKEWLEKFGNRERQSSSSSSNQQQHSSTTGKSLSSHPGATDSHRHSSTVSGGSGVSGGASGKDHGNTTDPSLRTLHSTPTRGDHHRPGVSSTQQSNHSLNSPRSAIHRNSSSSGHVVSSNTGSGHTYTTTSHCSTDSNHKPKQNDTSSSVTTSSTDNRDHSNSRSESSTTALSNHDLSTRVSRESRPSGERRPTHGEHPERRSSTNTDSYSKSSQHHHGDDPRNSSATEHRKSSSGSTPSSLLDHKHSSSSLSSSQQSFSSLDQHSSNTQSVNNNNNNNNLQQQQQKYFNTPPPRGIPPPDMFFSTPPPTFHQPPPHSSLLSPFSQPPPMIPGGALHRPPPNFHEIPNFRQPPPTLQMATGVMLRPDLSKPPPLIIPPPDVSKPPPGLLTQMSEHWSSSGVKHSGESGSGRKNRDSYDGYSSHRNRSPTSPQRGSSPKRRDRHTSGTTGPVKRLSTDKLSSSQGSTEQSSTDRGGLVSPQVKEGKNSSDFKKDKDMLMMIPTDLPSTPPSNLNLPHNSAKYNDDRLIGHVLNWIGDHLEKQCRKMNDESHMLMGVNCSQISVDLKFARSLVRVSEIQATLQEQRIHFLRQQVRELEEMKPESMFPS